MQSRKQRPPIEELVFIDDFFRVAENGLPPSPENRKFLRAFFGTGASRLGWRVRELSAQSQRGSICVPNIMESLALPANRDGWAATCTANLQPAVEHLAMLALTPASLVIGWGLTPAIMQYVDSQGAAFVDVEIDSIRFTRNLHLAVRTNDPGIREELEHLRIDEEMFWSTAAGLRGHFARRGHSSIVSADLSVGLFVGQTSVDLALVGGGRLAQPADFIEPIRQWAAEVDLLAIRPHPAEADTRQFELLLDSIPNALLIKHNTYSLLCADNLAFVGAISSGVLKEAPYLGCSDVRQLLVDDRNTVSLLPPECSPWIPVRLEVASARALEAFSAARSQVGSRLSAAPPPMFAEDTLTQIFAYRWGLDPAAGGLPEFPALAPEQSLNLASGTPTAASTFFTHGWHWPESWGAWTAEPRAWLLVPLDCPAPDMPDEGFVLTLRGHVFTSPSAQAPQVTIKVNGHECRTVARQDGALEWTVDLDADAARRRLLLIAIDVRGALRPCDVSEDNPDTRTLGIYLADFSLHVRQKHAPADVAEPAGSIEDDAAPGLPAPSEPRDEPAADELAHSVQDANRGAT
ncbi:hypothetical protein [Burkholderia sp. Ap-962]|uniref:hypothetical protein n=1 Tax=Burkholderia sp. Ap-962 TaxID=2608333 RepID=UPI00196471EF|nr:hypothetical protein [Burkholderia sp. Ap-962]